MLASIEMSGFKECVYSLELPKRVSSKLGKAREEHHRPLDFEIGNIQNSESNVQHRVNMFGILGRRSHRLFSNQAKPTNIPDSKVPSHLQGENQVNQDWKRSIRRIEQKQTEMYQDRSQNGSKLVISRKISPTEPSKGVRRLEARLVPGSASSQIPRPPDNQAQISSSENNFNFENLRNFPKPNNEIKDDLKICKLASIFKPFSRGWISVYNSYFNPKSMNSVFNLSTLRRFFMAIFAFEQRKMSLLPLLSEIESGIVIKIFETKPYFLNNQLISAVQRKNLTQDTCIFYEMQRPKRKEENLKLCFRLVLKCLETEFLSQILPTVVNDMSNITPKAERTLFYLYYFAQPDIGQSFKEVAHTFMSESRLRCNISKKMQKYVFPESNNRRALSKFSSFSRGFFASISKSTSMTNKLNKYLLLGFLSFSLWKQDIGEQPFSKYRALTKSCPLKNLIFFMADQNTNELKKMFSKWDSIVQRTVLKHRQKSKFNDENYSSQLQSTNPKNRGLREKIVSNIHNDISKPRFKFLWSICEIKHSFLEGILALNEVNQFSTKQPRCKKMSKFY